MYGGLAALSISESLGGIFHSIDRSLSMNPPILKARALESGSRQAIVFGVGVGFMGFITTVIALRVYARAVILRAMGVDDGMAWSRHFEQNTDIE